MSGLAFKPTRHREKITLSVTPLIDVLFLLIIFFMLTGTFKRLAELELMLPDSSTAEISLEQDGPRSMELVLTTDGRLFVQDEAVELESLKARLLAFRENNPESGALLNAESGVEHGRVVELLDIIREAGFPGVSLGTRPATQEEEKSNPKEN
ncbi:biopolymer transporter ExbD [bacterium]|nr:biopolymer transporter ExbD [bacterium]